MEKIMVSISELVKMGYPERSVREAVNGSYGNLFARRTSKRGKWIINLPKFQDYWDRGNFEQEGRSK